MSEQISQNLIRSFIPCFVIHTRVTPTLPVGDQRNILNAEVPLMVLESFRAILSKLEDNSVSVNIKTSVM